MAEKKQKPAGKVAEKPVRAKPEQPKNPKAEPSAARQASGTDPWSILMYPHLAEKSMKMVEAENKLVFMVRRTAKKAQIKQAIEDAFGVKVTRVNFEITMEGKKKAYVRLSPEFSASDIATRMGMV